MEPTLTGGDYIIASRYYCRLKKGDLVVVNHPIYNRIVKRIACISSKNQLQLQGDNPLSISREKIGWIAPSSIYGKVILQVKK